METHAFITSRDLRDHLSHAFFFICCFCYLFRAFQVGTRYFKFVINFWFQFSSGSILSPVPLNCSLSFTPIHHHCSVALWKSLMIQSSKFSKKTLNNLPAIESDTSGSSASPRGRKRSLGIHDNTLCFNGLRKKSKISSVKPVAAPLTSNSGICFLSPRSA